ncbi:putative membrane protein YeaQ/YmgE (transglycosylase-associated protein family) [Bradyrhizobium sp. USDA 4472]
MIWIKRIQLDGVADCLCQMFDQVGNSKMHILWTIIIGFVIGVVAKFIMPGDKAEPKGFILTTILGIVGAFAATYLGQAVGWYRPGESAGFIGGVVGAIILLFVYGLVAGRRAA